MPDHTPHAAPARRNQESEIDRLTRENLMLQAKVAGFHLLEQNLLESKHLLELESSRFERMKAFIRAAMRPLHVRHLAALICESMVDILECEIGCFWCFRSGRAFESVFTSSFPQLDERSWPELRDFLEACMAQPRFATNPDPRTTPPGLDIGDFLVRGVYGDEGECFGILLAANTNRNASHYGPLNPAATKPFDAFSEQVGAIIESRRSRAVIVEQAEKIWLSDQRLALALANSNVGLWDWNLSDNTVHFSEQWKKQLGYQVEEISDSFQEWRNRLHPDDARTAIEAATRCACDAGSSFETTFRMMHRDGDWRWIISNGTCLPDDSGRPARMIGTHIDITSLKAIEARLRKAEESQRSAKEEAVRANVAKSEFLAKISHDIRTPLNGVLAAFQMLQSDGLSTKARKLVDMGITSGNWMLGIIGESLDLSQIETGRLHLRLETFELPSLLELLEETSVIAARRKKIHIRWKQGKRLPEHCYGDRPRVKQIVANLIDNAIKFTPEGGRIAVSIQPIPAQDGASASLRFRIIDSGPGLSDVDISRIFKPFHQLSRMPSTHVEGLGLGLAIVRELVDLMGGSVKVASRIGRGSAFTVVLPLCTPPDEAPREKPHAKAWQRKFSGKVLFAEDDEISRELGVMVLEKLGLEVTAAADGLEALEELGKQRFDLAILDCWMPRVEGIEVASRIRKGEAADPAMPILALTANADVMNVDACFAAGMNDCLLKPVVVQRLEEKLARFLPSFQPDS